MMKNLFFIFLLNMLAGGAAAQSASEYRDRVSLIDQNISRYFTDSAKGLYYEAIPLGHNEKPHSYLWPLCALIQAANEAEDLQPAKDYMTPPLNAIGQYYNTNPPAPGYQAYVTSEEKSDRFYDDNQWIAIACIDAYNRTRKQNYLNIAKNIYRFMMTGYDTASGGGLYWKEGDKTSKNTCSNGPASLIALQLYGITKQKPLLDTALMIYHWTNAHLQSPGGVYWDNIKIPSLRIDSAAYTYNTGTMLQANVLLYNYSHEKKYLIEAQRLAKDAEAVFYKNDHLRGSYWFNAVLLRGLMELYKSDKNRHQLQFFIDDANRIWQQERDAQNLLGRNKQKSLIDQAAMMEIYSRLATLEK